MVEQRETNWNQLITDFKDLAGIVTVNNQQEKGITR